MAFDTWKINAAERYTGNITTAVRLDGTIMNIGGIPNIGGAKVTRHHLIDIRTLQDVWNKACDLEDVEVIGALAEWSGAPTRQIDAMKNSVELPNRIVQRICWNPFNIVVGPSSTVRPANPGDREFDFIGFVDTPSVATMEFNEHLRQLRLIDQLMRQYLLIPANAAAPQPMPRPGMHPMFGGAMPGASQVAGFGMQRENAMHQMTKKNLVTALLADRPHNYPKLFEMLRRLENRQKPAMDQQRDARIPQDINAQFSPDYIPGALYDPSFWDDTYVSRAQNVGSAGF
jgi:hypothetical protein